MAGTGQAAASGGHEQSFAAAHQALLSNHRLQFQFEDLKPTPPSDTRGWDWLAKLLEALAPLMQYVFWIGIIALVGLLLFLIVREVALRLEGVRFGKKKAAEAAPVVDFRPTAARARALLEEADRLAREGRYSEAARVLLHRSIDDMEAHFPITIGPAMTSREIAGIERLSANARDVFSRIAQFVEVSLFGGRDLDAGQYQECRRIYESFALGGAR